MRLSGWVPSSVSPACSVLPHLTLPPPRPFSKTCVLCLMVYWFLPGQQSLPLSSPSVKVVFPPRSPVTPPPSRGFHISNSLPTVDSVRVGSTQESSKYLAQPSGTQEILESMKRWVNEGFAHLPQPVLSVRSWCWDPFVPLSILQITILPPLISATNFEVHATWLKPLPYHCQQLSSLLSPLSLRLCSLAPASLPCQVWSDFSVHKDDAPSTLAFWFLDLFNTSDPHLHFSAIVCAPGFILKLIATWSDVMSNIFSPHGCKFPEADFQSSWKCSLHFYLQFLIS